MMDDGDSVYVVVRYWQRNGRDYADMDSVMGAFSTLASAQTWIKAQDGLDGCEDYSYDVERHALNSPSSNRECDLCRVST